MLLAYLYRILKSKDLFEGEVPYVIHIGGDESIYVIDIQFLKGGLI